MSRAGFIVLLLFAAGQLFAQEPPRFEQHIGAQLPLDTRLVDDRGIGAPLSNYFRDRPVIVIFGYYSCPQLCSVVEQNVVDSLRDLRPTVGRDFDVLYVSIDPSDTPAQASAKRAEAVRSYSRAASADGWHYVTGPERSVRAIAAAAGFGYRFDPSLRMYAHPSGIVVATPQGVISRYFLGLDYPAGELAVALRRAAAGKTGAPVSELLLECFSGGGFSGRYGILIWHALEASVLLTVIGVFGGIGWMLRSERARIRGREALR